MGLPDLVKSCDLFVYLNVQFRSFQFEEVPSSQIFIIMNTQGVPLPQLTLRRTCLPLPFACTCILNTHNALRFCNSLCGGGRVTCVPLPFAGASIVNTHKAFRFRNSLCGGGRMSCLPLPFACNSVINT